MGGWEDLWEGRGVQWCKVMERLECKKVYLEVDVVFIGRSCWRTRRVCSADRDLKMMRAATFFNQMLFMDELYRKVTLHSSSVAEISSLNSRRFILEELALELFPAGWNVAAPCCVLYGEIHEPRTNDAHLRGRTPAPELQISPWDGGLVRTLFLLVYSSVF